MFNIYNFIGKVFTFSIIFFVVFITVSFVSLIKKDKEVVSLDRIKSYEDNQCVFNQLKTENENKRVIKNSDINIANFFCNQAHIHEKQVNALKENI